MAVLCNSHFVFAQTVPLPSQWKFIMKDDSLFKSEELDESGWSEVMVPSGWFKLGSNQERAVGWYRVKVSVPANLMNKDLVLFGGMIDDADETYLNGRLLGSTGKFPPNDQTAWDMERKYVIDKSLLKPVLSIAIRVYNGIGDGGIYGGRLMLMAKADYDKQVADQIRSKKSYYKLTTSNGLVAAVYDEQTSMIESFYPHIFSYYDSGLVVRPILSNLKSNLTSKPVATSYLRNTHVVEVKYPGLSLYYYASFLKANKCLYILARGKKAALDKLDFDYEAVSGKVKRKVILQKTEAGYDKLFVYGFSDTLNNMPELNEKVWISPEEEVQYMRSVINKTKIPKQVSITEKNVIEQGISILKMSQVGEKEIIPLAKGQVLASLRPGVWAICWVRDGSFAIEAMSKLGMYEEARSALSFMLNAKPTNQYTHYVHTDGIDYGLGVPYIISLTRYFGNGREECDYTTDGGPNIEIDDLGLFLTAFYHYVNESGDAKFLREYESSIRVIATAINKNINEKNIIRRDSGPWEHHLPGKEFMWTSGTCARGLELMGKLFKSSGMEYLEFVEGSSRLYGGVMQNCLVKGRYIKGNATERLPSDHHYFDAATFELFANGLVNDRKLFASHMAEYNGHIRALHDTTRGYIRFDSNDSYENQEWPFAGLRVAVAQNRLGSRREAKKLVDRITLFASRNHNQIPEILTNETNLYSGAIPMVGYGSGAYIIAVLALLRPIRS
jgi:hypothetical protein